MSGVALIIQDLVRPGGSERQCVELARGLAMLGIRVQLFTIEGSLSVHESAPIDAEIVVHAIGRSRTARLLGRLHAKLDDGWEMVRLGGAVARSAKDAILQPQHYPAQWAAVIAARHTKQPIIWLCNDWIYSDVKGTGVRRVLRSALRHLLLSIDRYAARQCTSVLALSHMTGADIARGYDIPVTVFRTGANGTSQPTSAAERQAARQALGLEDDLFVLSTVCILMPHRRVEDVITALATLSPSERATVRFLHIGGTADVSSEKRLRRAVQDAELSDVVHLLGAVPETVRKQALAASDAFIFPVEGQSWGIAPFEAMAAGIPVILSRSSGAAEVVRHERDVLLYDARDTATLAQHIRRLRREPETVARLSVAGRDRWATRFTWPRASRRFARQLRVVQQHLSEHR